MTVTLTFPIPRAFWFTANSRLHWTARARKTRQLRELGGLVGNSEINRLRLARPVFDRCRVTVEVSYPTVTRADPANTAPVSKALIDGLTDAGYWPDDDSRHLVEVAYRRSPTRCPKGQHLITMTITPIYKE
ncbi:RusA family crossover junction endodeoxyribonuclease [Bifidobacterium platyrrhinorum]|uniref:Uncharacterized protein n=1 Tax=Bifidobacterium platyrrhinorum TaxID=2661628 RepID=A0A6L9SSE1_9BIFI|nr:hypothetical protein [Bifidobacterium platyrrhinorum]NEG55418.1 hypothetical protein [Bifidobacterium platyrrhinorum]